MVSREPSCSICYGATKDGATICELCAEDLRRMMQRAVQSFRP